ncbi:MAG: hypothetical protein FJ395_14050 [Verrucomicrobia bacterium]|nr:hypothetical protein [Verrucomicrobiota bacterium]
MYGFECDRKLRRGVCPNKRCIFPDVCPQLPIDHAPLVEVLRRVRAMPGVKKAFVASGIRYDMLRDDA